MPSKVGRFGVWAALAVTVLGTLVFVHTVLQGYRERKAVEALSWALANQVVVVDPGHGGIDAGARGPGGTLEAEVVLGISRNLAAFLRQGGARVFLTREDEEAPEGESGDDLVERVRLAQKVGADIFVSVHANAFNEREYGAQVFFNPGSKEGERLAAAIQEEIRRLLKNTEREPLGLDAFVLRSLNIPAVIVEVGFLSNPQEEKLLRDKDYQRRMAFAIYSGIARYLAERKR
ncbi:MAG: N-acetylmuramoyl-L-alanine amidase [Thermanaeromonas sp.]|uniref:N-acetylmuramoyl-L-alanine amidase n=1 Tax=Thermanaeromonas sp. TaxID=2003697 RepID=UPI002437A1B8|nr:N-acetylmuramoyl-L-alanine amidase [Thermanaeromonas sp.]MCG0277151.1 N-acetylmuramoyl-L-alanine amidase [Thermanaeromonas sp.]